MRILTTLKAMLLANLLFASVSAIAADYDVTAITNYLAEYKGKYVLVLRNFEQSSAPLPERLEMYEKAMNQLKEEFKNKRKQEYANIAVFRSVEHSCTKGSSGGVKNCGTKSVTIENENMYTKREWTSVKGTDKGHDVSANGRTAWLKMTRAGRGRNAGTLTAKYVYHPDKIEILSEKDMTELFRQIVTK